MNEMERALFDKLTRDRKESAVILEKTSMTGLKNSVVDKYTDQAHFIYELIQNADDVGASEARFELYRDRLVFIHNGTRLFTVTDLDNEAVDTENGTLGDLNAITSVANSSKKDDASIGKFGVGFKAVFQYTTTPYIYDPNISFKIERFIVPVLLDEVFADKAPNETAFVFPFDHPKRTAYGAYEDISHKLQNLIFPTLFLNNLKSIKYKTVETEGEYVKSNIETRTIGNTCAEFLEFKGGKATDRMWLFTRKTEEGYKYSCGFSLGSDGKLKATEYMYAFCFFPTKKETNLSFVINAPFLLTDSREGIKAGESHNIKMISCLAELAADCYTYLRDIGLENNIMLIDDNFLELIPYKKELYEPKDERSDISLLPFYEKIKNAFMNEQLLPSFSAYAFAKDAYMPLNAHLVEVFNNSHLQLLYDNAEAQWIIPSIGWEPIYRTRDGRADYLTDIIPRQRIDDMRLLGMISEKFTLAQDIEWLISLYRYILENDRRIEHCKDIPVYVTQSGKAYAAYNSAGKAILFLADDSSRGYEVISDALFNREETQKLAQRMGISTPELKDKIYNKILKNNRIDTISSFKALLDYYIELRELGVDTCSYINDLTSHAFILSTTEDGISKDVYKPKEVYYPSEELKYYFEGCGETLFVSVDTYMGDLTSKEKNYFNSFLTSLGVNYAIKSQSKEYCKEDVEVLFGSEWPKSTQQCVWTDYEIDNYRRVLDRIADNEDIRLSELLWNALVNLYSKENHFSKIAPTLGGIYSYHYHSSKVKSFEGFCVHYLKHSKWLFDKNGIMRSPTSVTIQEISYRYEIASQGAKKIIALLGIRDEHPEYRDLGEELVKKLERIDLLESSGLFDLPENNIKEIIKQFKEKTITIVNPSIVHGNDVTNVPTNASSEAEKSETIEDKVIRDISERVHKKMPKQLSQNEENEADSDEITKATVDYSKQIEKAKQKCEEEITRLAHIEEIQNKANDAKKYSYAWFEALLQLEAISSGEESANSREVSIAFSTISRDEGTSRTLILSHPDKNIPHVMEELVDIPLELTFFDGQTKKLIIEAANVQSYTLRVKVKADEFLDAANWESVTRAKIVTQNPSFLTKELQKAFAKLTEAPFELDEDYDMQANLCDNIQFIFGPPGTGKTTYLANDVLIPLVKDNDDIKILVLAPTNKAADVLTSRIMQIMGNDKSYVDWLIRYGITADVEIEQSHVFHGKEFDIATHSKNVIVTTMARFPYDYFIDSAGDFNHLHGINWDYIVVDEASMIPLVQMVYMLYLKTPKKFIIAGDPFQIEPTTAVSEWKGENIYKMINLEEFSDDADTTPHKYDIKLLTTQYRSIESIGEVFSQLTYNGVLKHVRENESARPLNIEGYLDYQNLNIITFPVMGYESIYRAKRLKLSSYHVYSALFVYEFATYISKALAISNSDTEIFKIGIIAPYGAQAGLIDKLVESADIPRNIEITSGTIHGFQGDECDIVIALFNPPPHISTNKEMFLNRQNIINVAISRARDYLFVLVPDEDTENVQNLWLINKMKKLIQNDIHSEQVASEIEEILFEDNRYIEENAFSTGHQSVNVYGMPERRYEIRSEENAIDIQVHGNSEYVLMS